MEIYAEHWGERMNNANCFRVRISSGVSRRIQWEPTDISFGNRYAKYEASIRRHVWKERDGKQDIRDDEAKQMCSEAADVQTH